MSFKNFKSQYRYFLQSFVRPLAVTQQQAQNLANAARSRSTFAENSRIKTGPTQQRRPTLWEADALEKLHRQYMPKL